MGVLAITEEQKSGHYCWSQVSQKEYGIGSLGPYTLWQGLGFYSKGYESPGQCEQDNEMTCLLFKKKIYSVHM